MICDHKYARSITERYGYCFNYTNSLVPFKLTRFWTLWQVIYSDFCNARNVNEPIQCSSHDACLMCTDISLHINNINVSRMCLHCPCHPAGPANLSKAFFFSSISCIRPKENGTNNSAFLISVTIILPLAYKHCVDRIAVCIPTPPFTQFLVPYHFCTRMLEHTYVMRTRDILVQQKKI